MTSRFANSEVIKYTNCAGWPETNSAMRGPKAPSSSVRKVFDAADDGFADLRGDRKVLEHFISDEALIDAAQSVGKSFQYAF